MPKSFLSKLKGRKKEIDEAVADDGTEVMRKQESGEDYPASVHSRPATVKVFSDGTTRYWNDEKQEWVTK